MKKNFRNFFIGSKDPPSNFRGVFGDRVNIWLHLRSKSPKNTLLSLKKQKRTQLLNSEFLVTKMTETVINRDKLTPGYSVFNIRNQYQFSRFFFIGYFRLSEKIKKIFLRKAKECQKKWIRFLREIFIKTIFEFWWKQLELPIFPRILCKRIRQSDSPFPPILINKTS